MNRKPQSRDTRAAWLLGGIALIAAAAAAWEWRVAPSVRSLATAIRTFARNDARLKDWAGLNRYRNENRSLETADGRKRVVFFGDSITDFWQLPRSGGFFPGRPYVDRGIAGQTTGQMLVRFRPDVLDLNPAAVVILAGTNDIAGEAGPATDGEIEGNLASMCELAERQGVRVILASLLPVSTYHPQPHEPGPSESDKRPAARLAAINSWMQAYAARSGHVYLDYHSAMVDAAGELREEFSDDDLHPNAKGYAAMAPLAEQAIERALH